MRFSKLFMSAALALTMSAFTAMAGKPEAERWINSEFQPSALSKNEQMAEMEWFIKAAEPFKVWRSMSCQKPFQLIPMSPRF